MAAPTLKQYSPLPPDEAEAKAQLVPGVKLYGFLDGLFGRDSYGPKVVVEAKSDCILATERGAHMESRTIDGSTYTWCKVIEDSNRALESGDYEVD